MIGTFGPVTFTVSEQQVRTFDALSRTESARWSKHDVIAKKPVSEFLGPDLGALSFVMHFNATLGVNPRKETDQLIRIVREGEVYPFILGDRRFGMGKYSLKSVKVDFKRVDNRGNVLIAEANVSLEEYV